MTITTEIHNTNVQGNYAACSCGWRSPPVFMDAGKYAEWHRLAIAETIDNPYLRAFLASPTKDAVRALGAYGSEYLAARAGRDRLAAKYAWAIPTESVIRELAKLSPICDLGCGTGYWAKLLHDVGAKVLAVDTSPPLEGNNRWHRQEVGILRESVTLQHFVAIVKGDAATFAVPSGHALMLCWPPYNTGMAAQALARYTGDHVIYIGEADGCTGDDDFRKILTDQWKLDANYEIPQWDGLHDDVSVYVRRSAENDASFVTGLNAENRTKGDAEMSDDYYNGKLSELIGKTLSAVTQNGEESIDFESSSGERWQMFYDPDCCAHCTIEDVVGDLSDLVGSPIVMAEASTNNDNPKAHAEGFYDESHTWTFYKLATAKGYVTIRWYGSSNGYYSETASFRRLSS